MSGGGEIEQRRGGKEKEGGPLAGWSSPYRNVDAARSEPSWNLCRIPNNSGIFRPNLPWANPPILRNVAESKRSGDTHDENCQRVQVRQHVLPQQLSRLVLADRSADDFDLDGHGDSTRQTEKLQAEGSVQSLVLSPQTLPVRSRLSVPRSRCGRCTCKTTHRFHRVLTKICLGRVT